MTQLQANFAAVAAGDSGAPLIQAAALDSAIVGNSHLEASVTGTFIEATGATGSGNSTTSPVKITQDIQVGRSGIYSVKHTMSNAAGNGAVYGRSQIYVDGVAVGTTRTGNGTWTEDVTVTAGQTIAIYGWCTIASNYSNCTLFDVRSGAPLLSCAN